MEQEMKPVDIPAVGLDKRVVGKVQGHFIGKFFVRAPIGKEGTNQVQLASGAKRINHCLPRSATLVF